MNDQVIHGEIRPCTEYYFENMSLISAEKLKW